MKENFQKLSIMNQNGGYCSFSSILQQYALAAISVSDLTSRIDCIAHVKRYRTNV